VELQLQAQEADGLFILKTQLPSRPLDRLTGGGVQSVLGMQLGPVVLTGADHRALRG